MRESLFRGVEGSIDLVDLLEGKQVGTDSAMGTKDPVVDDCGEG